MNIDNISNQSFSGAFRVRKPSEDVVRNLSELIKGRGKQIFNNFENTGDVFIVTRDNYDRVVAKFVKDNNLPLEYYPKINTKSGLDSEEPQRLSELLKNNELNQPITNIAKFKKYVNNLNRKDYIEYKSPTYVDNILKALCIDNNHEIRTKKGAKIVVDNEFDRKIFISPPSKNNIHYVRVQPNLTDKTVERYAIDADGNILQVYKSPDAIKKFIQRFNSLLLDK